METEVNHSGEDILELGRVTFSHTFKVYHEELKIMWRYILPTCERNIGSTHLLLMTSYMGSPLV